MTIKQQYPLAARNVDGLAIRGRTKHDLMGIRYGEGEGGNAPDGQQQNDGDSGGQQSGDQKPPWGDDKSKFDPDKAWNLITNLRSDIAAEKDKRDKAITDAVSKAEKDILGSIAKALGGGEEQETDPVKLNQSLAELTSKLTEKDTTITAKDAEIKAGQVALQVALHAPGLGGNTALLLKNEQFKTSIASVEPTDEAAIKAAITKALQENAALKQPPARSGTGDHTGPTVTSLEAQLKAAEEKKDIPETIRLKRAIASAKAAQQA